MKAIEMKTAIEEILEKQGLKKEFETSRHFSVKIEVPGFMPLSIEKHGRQITVTHYFEQNGDLIPDPDMEFEDSESLWLPVAIQHASGAYYRAVEYQDGHQLIDRKELRDQILFSQQWARNLLNQGFARGNVVRAEAC